MHRRQQHLPFSGLHPGITLPRMALHTQVRSRCCCALGSSDGDTRPMRTTSVKRKAEKPPAQPTEIIHSRSTTPHTNFGTEKGRQQYYKGPHHSNILCKKEKFTCLPSLSPSRPAQRAPPLPSQSAHQRPQRAPLSGGCSGGTALLSPWTPLRSN